MQFYSDKIMGVMDDELCYFKLQYTLKAKHQNQTNKKLHEIKLYQLEIISRML